MYGGHNRTPINTDFSHPKVIAVDMGCLRDGHPHKSVSLFKMPDCIKTLQEGGMTLWVL